MQGAGRVQGALTLHSGAPCELLPLASGSHACTLFHVENKLHLFVCSPTPQMASMLEGGGKTPILTPSQLEGMGFKLCAYPLSLLGVS